MASLFEIGKTGVQAYRQALSVTGQNIANINTEGYNKRSADITEIAGVSGGATNVSDSSGLGVRVANIRRSFDSYLSDKTRTSQSDYEMLNDFVSKLSDLENMLLPSGSDLGVFIGRFLIHYKMLRVVLIVFQQGLCLWKQEELYLLLLIIMINNLKILNLAQLKR